MQVRPAELDPSFDCHRPIHQGHALVSFEQLFSAYAKFLPVCQKTVKGVRVPAVGSEIFRFLNDRSYNDITT